MDNGITNTGQFQSGSTSPTSAAAANQMVKTVSCTSFNLEYQPTKHFVYEIHLKWSDGRSTAIYRRYSQFFNLQQTLVNTFPLEAGIYHPSKRTIPFLPGKRFVGNLSIKTAEKRRSKFDEYLKVLITLKRVGNSDPVIQFLETKESDLVHLTDKRKSSRTSRPPSTGLTISSPLEFPQYTVIENYTKTQQGELTVTAGTVLYIIEKKRTGWWLAQDAENTGWVPACYLDPVYSTVGQGEEPSPTPSHPMKYVVTVDYLAAEGDELSVARGCVLEAVTESTDGWWTCRYSGHQGLFPAAYLRKADSIKARKLLASLKTSTPAPQEPLTRKRRLSHYAPPRRGCSYKEPKQASSNLPSQPPVPAARTLHEVDYVATGDFKSSMHGSNGIDLVEGASIKVLNKDESGWWFVQTGGVKGWAPSTYMEPATHLTYMEPVTPSLADEHESVPSTSPTTEVASERTLSATGTSNKIGNKPPLAAPRKRSPDKTTPTPQPRLRRSQGHSPQQVYSNSPSVEEQTATINNLDSKASLDENGNVSLLALDQVRYRKYKGKLPPTEVECLPPEKHDSSNSVSSLVRLFES